MPQLVIIVNPLSNAGGVYGGAQRSGKHKSHYALQCMDLKNKDSDTGWIEL